MVQAKKRAEPFAVATSNNGPVTGLFRLSTYLNEEVNILIVFDHSLLQFLPSHRRQCRQ